MFKQFNVFRETAAGCRLQGEEQAGGFDLLAAKRYPAARREFQQNILARACCRHADSSGNDSKGAALAYYGLGRALQGINEDERALGHYLEALRLEPSCREACFSLAELLWKKYQNIGQVTAFLETHLQLFSRGELILLAEICFHLKEYRLALLYLKMFKERKESARDTGKDSKLRGLDLLYARVLLGAGEYQKASQLLREVNGRDFPAVRSESPGPAGREARGCYLDFCLASWLSSPEGGRERPEGSQESQENQQGVREIRKGDGHKSAGNRVKTEREQEKQFKQGEQRKAGGKQGEQRKVESKQGEQLRMFLAGMYQNQAPSGRERDSGAFCLALMERALHYQKLDFCRAAADLLTADSLLERGEGYFRTGELYYLYGYEQLAAGQLQQYLEEGFAQERAYYYLGIIREKAGDLSGAERYYRQALRLNWQLEECRLAAARTALKRAERVGKRALAVIPDFELADGDAGYLSFPGHLRVIKHCIKRLSLTWEGVYPAFKKGGSPGGRAALTADQTEQTGEGGQKKEQASPTAEEGQGYSSLRRDHRSRGDFYQEEFREALDDFRQRKGRQGGSGREIYYYHQRTLDLIKEGQYGEGLKTLAEGIGLFPDCRSLWFLQGEVNILNRQYPEARRAYRRCLALPDNERLYPLLVGVGSFLAYQSLGEIDEEAGAEERGVYYYLQALTSNPDYRPAGEGIRRIYRRQLARILKYLEPDDLLGEGSPAEGYHYYLCREWLKVFPGKTGGD